MSSGTRTVIMTAAISQLAAPTPIRSAIIKRDRPLPIRFRVVNSHELPVMLGFKKLDYSTSRGGTRVGRPGVVLGLALVGLLAMVIGNIDWIMGEPRIVATTSLRWANSVCPALLASAC